MRADTRRLCELTSAADMLDVRNLVDLTSRALARLIEVGLGGFRETSLHTCVVEGKHFVRSWDCPNMTCISPCMHEIKQPHAGVAL